VRDPQDPIAAATHPDPYPYYRRLRETQPLYFDRDCGFWVASGVPAIRAVLESAHCHIRPPAQPVPPNLAGTGIAPVFTSLVRMTDGDFHRRMKAAVVAGLAQVDGVVLQAIIDEGLAALVPAGTADLRMLLADLQYRLPAFVIARLLGIEAGDCHNAATRVAPFVAAMAAGASGERVEQGCQAAQMLLAMLTKAGETPTSAPANLTITLLRQAREQGLGPQDALANCLGFLMQTFDATAGLIGNGFLALARLPCGSGGLDWEDFVDEVLRYDPPVQNTRRIIAQDIMIDGHVLKAGDAVVLVLAAANRDPSLNPDPDMFRLIRVDRRLMTFGHGRHLCPGQAIARRLAAAALRLLSAYRDRLSLSSVEAVKYRPLPNARIPEFTA